MAAGHAPCRVVTHPRTWELWTYSRRVVAWVLGWELVILAWAVLGTRSDPLGSAAQWWTCAALIVGAVVHHRLTIPGEERRFAIDVLTSPTGEHVELTGVWFVPGAMLLTVPQMAVLLVVVRYCRWRIARKGPAQWIFTSMSILGGMLATHDVVGLFSRDPWHGHGLFLPLVLAGSALASYVVETVLIPGVKALGGDTPALLRPGQGKWWHRQLAHRLRPLVARQSRGRPVAATCAVCIGHSGQRRGRAGWSLMEWIGTPRENAQLLIQLALACALTAVIAWSPLGVVIATPIAVAATVLVDAEAAWRAAAGSDSKTGLANNQGWRPQVTGMLRQSTPDAPVALLMLDVDNLKRLNSDLGHVGADEVLAAVAGVLREQPLPGRFGGDEFVVALPDTSLAQARIVAERIRRTVAGLKIPVTLPAGGRPLYVGDDYPAVSVTIGVAVAPHDGRDLDVVIAAADAKLMAGKITSRNAVYV